MYLTVCPRRGLGSIPGHVEVFQGIFLLVDHTLSTHRGPVCGRK